MKTSEEGSVPFFWVFIYHNRTTRTFKMKLLSVLVLILWGFLVSSCAVVKYFVCSSSSSSAGSCCCSESRWECFLVWVRLLCSSTIFKKCKNRCTAFPLFSKWAAILKLLFWLVMSEQTKEGMLLKLLNCRVDVLWNGPHGRSWRGVGRAWYQSSVVLLFMPGWKAPPYGHGFVSGDIVVQKQERKYLKRLAPSWKQNIVMNYFVLIEQAVLRWRADIYI